MLSTLSFCIRSSELSENSPAWAYLFGYIMHVVLHIYTQDSFEIFVLLEVAGSVWSKVIFLFQIESQ